MEAVVSTSQKTVHEELPEDVLIDILSRLPAKSLIRFISVCKRWYALIQNPNFISLHHSRAQPGYCASYLDTDPNNPRWHLLFDQSSIHELDFSFPRPPHLLVSSLYHGYRGSCHGLICLSVDRMGRIVILNPAIRECRQLPKPPCHSWWTRYVGFAYDSKTNDYKVVRVAVSPSTNQDDKIHIYSMSADSWKEIASIVSHRGCTSYCQPCMSLDGIFYWLSYDSCTRVHGIDALNTVEGSFERRPLPAGVMHIWEIGLCLLDDSIAVVVPKHDEQRGETGFVETSFDVWLMDKYGLRGETWFDVWLMDKYGLEEFWTKKYTIGPLIGLLKPFGFVPNSDILLTWNEYGKIVSYHHNTNSIEEYKQLCGLLDPNITHVFPYSESLVSVKRRADLA